MKTEDRCVEQVWHDFVHGQCSRKGRYKESGKIYCGTHLPSRVKEKSAARAKKWDEEWAKKRECWDKEEKDKKWGEIGPELLEALKAFDEGFKNGSIKWAKPRQSDADPYHKANILMCKAISKAEGEK